MMSTISPIQWMGGQLFEIYKGSGDASSPVAYRDTILTDADCKPFLGCLRANLRPRLQEAAPPSQFGGG
eukprot:8361486-Karenia_brevis.AAC.1